MTSLGWLLQPAVFPWAALALGLCVGSFLNVVIHRLPRMMEREWRAQCDELRGTSPDHAPALTADEQIPGAAAAAAETPQEAAEPYNLVVPRSACPACGHRITAIENVPIVSYAFLRGKCSACGAPISLRYPLVEAAAGLLAAYAATRFGATPAALGAMLFGWCLLALALIDADTQLLPDDITLPLMWAGLLVNLFGVFAPLPAAVIGAAAGYLALWSVYWLFKFATGKEGMGYGDFKLLAAIGAWLGWQALPMVILLSAVLGAAVGIALMVFSSHARDRPIPFGPYLALAGAVAMFGGPQVTGLYTSIFQ